MAVSLFVECRFELVDGDRVLAAIHIERVILVVDFKDLEQPVVGVLQRTTRSVMANVHIIGGSQGVRLVSRVAAVVLLCRWQDGAHAVLELVEELRGCLHVLWLMREKLPGDTKGSVIYEI